jgi:subtilisin family serine protease
VLPLKALDQAGDGSWMNVAAAILYAADQGARVINLSFGAVDSSSTIEAAVGYAQSKGSLLVAAAGNGGAAVMYPAALAGVLAISASGNNDLPWSLSNRGPQVDVAAPGVDIFSLNAMGFYYQNTGTSMSAPQASGLAALIWSMRPELSALQVAQVITSTAHDIWSPGKDDLTGWGRIDAQSALFSIAAHAYLPLFETSSPQSVYYQYLPVLLVDSP